MPPSMSSEWFRVMNTVISFLEYEHIAQIITALGSKPKPHGSIATQSPDLCG